MSAVTEGHLCGFLILAGLSHMSGGPARTGGKSGEEGENTEVSTAS